MLTQQTIKETIKTTGIGLHSGQRVEMTFHPASPNTGIIFRRVDLNPIVDIPASALLVRDTRLSTCLITDEGVRVGTIEHLMSAAAGLGIDNMIVDLTASEVPILDGSAAAFIFLLQNSGIQKQAEPKRFLRILKTVEVRDGDKWARVSPHKGFQIAFQIQFNHPMFSEENQKFEFDAANQAYTREISRARTFGFASEVEMMYSMGLAQGGNLDNAIVLDHNRVINPDGLRYQNEFVRHKILDAIGDLYLLGHPLIGRIEAYKSSHALNNALAREILATNDSYEIIDGSQPTRISAEETNWNPMVHAYA